MSGEVTVEKTSVFHFYSGIHEFLSGFTTKMLIESDYSFPVTAESENQYYADNEGVPIFKVLRAVLANQDFSEYLE